jgi:hypothetical protein
VRTLLLCVIWSLSCAGAIFSEDASPSVAPTPDAAEIPKGYEVGENRVSPDGRFAILNPAFDEESMVDPGLPNLLVRLKPYAVLAKFGEPTPRHYELVVEWNGNSFVAAGEKRKWGLVDLSVYEIENDKVKRVQRVFRAARKYFGDTTFVSDSNEERGEREFEFKGRKLLLNLFADTVPNLAGGPHRTAELHAIWNLDKAKFEKVDFRPGKIEVRPDL